MKLGASSVRRSCWLICCCCCCCCCDVVLKGNLMGILGLVSCTRSNWKRKRHPTEVGGVTGMKWSRVQMLTVCFAPSISTTALHSLHYYQHQQQCTAKFSCFWFAGGCLVLKKISRKQMCITGLSMAKETSTGDFFFLLNTFQLSSSVRFPKRWLPW